MDEFELLVDLHKGANRQGPGGDAETEKAITLAGLDRDVPLKIADIGCGTGASTLTLAHLLNAKITAVDFLQDFIDVLAARAQSDGVKDKSLLFALQWKNSRLKTRSLTLSGLKVPSTTLVLKRVSQIGSATLSQAG